MNTTTRNHTRFSTVAKRIFKPTGAHLTTDGDSYPVTISAPILTPASSRRATALAGRPDPRVGPMPFGTTSTPTSTSPAPRRNSNAGMRASIGLDALKPGLAKCGTKPRSHSLSSPHLHIVVSSEDRKRLRLEKMRAFEELLASTKQTTVRLSLTPTLAC